MTDPKLIPPLALVQQWVDLLPQGSTKAFTAAVQWGAHRELEACCELLNDFNTYHLVEPLRIARRPKPQSLKEQALAALDDAIMRGDCITISDALPTIRRAIEALPE